MRKSTFKLASLALLTMAALSGCGQLAQLIDVTDEPTSEVNAADQPKTVASVLTGQLTLADGQDRTTVPDNGGLFILYDNSALNSQSTAEDEAESLAVHHVASLKDGTLTFRTDADWNGREPVTPPSKILCFGDDPGSDLTGIAVYKNFMLGPDTAAAATLSKSEIQGLLALQHNAEAEGTSSVAVLVAELAQTVKLTCPVEEGVAAEVTEFQVQAGLNVMIGQESANDRTAPKVWRVARASDEFQWKYTPIDTETPEQDPGPASLSLGTYDLLRQAGFGPTYSTVKVGTLTVESGDMTVELEPAVAQAQRSGLQAINLCPNDTSGVQIAYSGPPISLVFNPQGEGDDLARIVSSAPENASGGLSLVHANSGTSGAVTLECEVKVNDEVRIRRWSEVTLNEGWNLLRYARSGDSQESTPVDVWTNADQEGIDLAWELEPPLAPPN